jgi:hypothetical protein
MRPKKPPEELPLIRVSILQCDLQFTFEGRNESPRDNLILLNDSIILLKQHGLLKSVPTK